MLTVPEVGLQELYIGSSPPGSPRTQESCGIAPLTPSQSPKPEARAPQQASFSVVVAIDFGTTSSGYAFSFASDPEAIHMMRKWEGGDPGVAHQKTPTCLLLTPEGAFHSFGYTARDYYHDLDPEEARDWLYFEKFKMKIHSTTDLTLKTQLEAVNGKKMPALEVFAHALRFFKEHALQELRDQCPSLPEKDTVRWVLTVPAIWKQPAKQFMREAAYLAGLVSREAAEQLLIALEPEAASVYCRKLRLHQLVDLSSRVPGSGRQGERRSIDSSFRQAREQLRRSRHSRTFLVESGVGELWAEMQAGDRYMVADCGGGTVDLTVHQLEQPHGTLKELYKASGGPCGAVGVDLAFEQLLGRIFGEDFIATFKRQRPAAWVDLTIAFEARKRTAGPHRAGALNISLPFSFIDFYRKQRGHNVETALRRSSVNFVKWSSQGMLRMSCEAMNDLFQPTVSGIIQHIGNLLETSPYPYTGMRPRIIWNTWRTHCGGDRETGGRMCSPARGAAGAPGGAGREAAVPGGRLRRVGRAAAQGAGGAGRPRPARGGSARRGPHHPQGRRALRAGAGRGAGAPLAAHLRRGRAQPLRGWAPPARQAAGPRRPPLVHRRVRALRGRRAVGGPGRGGAAQLLPGAPRPAARAHQPVLQRRRGRALHHRPGRAQVRRAQPGARARRRRLPRRRRVP
ncbi:heat shock 70 kDa protein 12B isoform X1 [Hippopotamus amphibius kiboko]|uniref:heat shock 70 kDa protein 12B isoform X1 n=1 Tax=Hippopotamus amphibius kiboko TaxID=575201 RepID=UPI0025947CD6|nr:heat shock 70 kDa protein 12B isoform X1 [Hippopotamus amphibius kiboko]XP_057558149.1 heat shock 70 kDa protein 12B isoform X1 [Hippopotamus amphibius kiboko]